MPHVASFSIEAADSEARQVKLSRDTSVFSRRRGAHFAGKFAGSSKLQAESFI